MPVFQHPNDPSVQSHYNSRRKNPASGRKEKRNAFFFFPFEESAYLSLYSSSLLLFFLALFSLHSLFHFSTKFSFTSLITLRSLQPSFHSFFSVASFIPYLQKFHSARDLASKTRTNALLQLTPPSSSAPNDRLHIPFPSSLSLLHSSFTSTGTISLQPNQKEPFKHIFFVISSLFVSLPQKQNMSSFPPPTELDTVAIHPLAASQTQLCSATAIAPTAVISEEEVASGRPSTSGTLGNNRSSLESHGVAVDVHLIHDDDAITRHQLYPIGPEKEQQIPSPLQPQQQQQQQQEDQFLDGQSSSPPVLTTRTTRSRTRTSSRVSVDYSIPSFRLSKTDVSLCVDQSEAVCEIHDHHGPTAIAEEEAALEHSAALTAAKQAALLSQQRAIDIEATAGAGMRRESGAGVSTGFRTCCLRRSSSCLCLPPLRPHHRHNVMVASSNIADTSQQSGRHSERQGADGGEEDENEEDDHPEDVDEEESDHFYSGICLPRSQFFQTSVICSNTMARDALGK